MFSRNASFLVRQIEPLKQQNQKIFLQILREKFMMS
jgi:hypothetical protein